MCTYRKFGGAKRETPYEGGKTFSSDNGRTSHHNSWHFVLAPHGAQTWVCCSFGFVTAITRYVQKQARWQLVYESFCRRSNRNIGGGGTQNF
jgi:hypothetical protein